MAGPNCPTNWQSASRNVTLVQILNHLSALEFLNFDNDTVWMSWMSTQYLRKVFTCWKCPSALLHSRTVWLARSFYLLALVVKIFSEDRWRIDIKIAELYWLDGGGPGWQSAVAWVPIIMGDNKWWTFIGFIRRHHSPHHSYITRGQGGKLSSEEYKVLDIVGITFINLKSSNNKFYQTDQTRR